MTLVCCMPDRPAAAGGVTPSEPIGYVSIRCGDLSIALSLDETGLGLCPLDSIRVAPGEHLLRGWPVEGRRFSSTFFSRAVVVRAGRETVVDLSGLRWVRLETDPFGAHVTRAGAPLGRTPLTLSVSKGDPPVLVEKEGYRLVPISAESLLSGRPTKRIALELLRGHTPTAAIGVSPPAERKRLGFKTVLLGMTVIGSASAAVALSKEADDTFEEYKTIGDRDRMNSLFNRAERLDTWSVASWIVSEVALGALLYHLLHDAEPAAGDEPVMKARSGIPSGDGG